MTTKAIKKLVVQTVNYETDDVWAVVNPTDEIMVVGITGYRTMKAFVGNYETLEDDTDIIEEQFDQLMKEMPGYQLIQMRTLYTVERKSK
jgi:hypothetical protein